MNKENLTGLGRRIQHDERNRNYPMPKLLVPSEVRRRYWWGAGVLDQGATPQCVGYAGYGWLLGGPTTNEPSFSPTDLYNWAQERDEWPGNDYDGTSTLGLMKALKDKGYINEYRWAWDAETVVAWLLMSGPVLAGTWWTYDMFMPHDETGYITFTGDKVGGHEYRLVGCDRDRANPDGSTGAVRMVNSWGAGWAQQGRCWITFETLDALIKDQGEAVTAMEIDLG